MKTTKRIVPSIIIGLFVIMASSCSSNDAEYSQELKNQVSALQTQNALLQENLYSQENNLEAPAPPSDELSGVVIIDKTPTPEALPTNPVPAGQPIIYDGWAITVSKELYIDSYYEGFGIAVYVRNIGDTSRVFRYTKAGVTIMDDSGTLYEMVDSSSCEEYLNLTMNLDVGPEDSEKVEYEGMMWCDRADQLSLYKGPISLEAEQLIVHFTDFGPFTNVDVVIDL